MSPAWMLSVSITGDTTLLRSVVAMFSKMVRRVSSSVVLAEPMMRSASATCLRSVRTVMPEQKKLMPPSTTGIAAVSRVFICCASSPSLGSDPAAMASVSMALTTKSTNTTELSTLDELGIQSTPSGMLKETNWSGNASGLSHILAAGAQSCVVRVSGSGMRESNVCCSAKVLAVYLVHASRKPSVTPSEVARRAESPCPTSTESRGIRPSLRFGWYCGPSVNVTCT
mmetsp:Transcript_23549/g.47536  ORF Transcript_23549/g.47536 Transcript_23549/m.47536 type:complete len:227 (-) Transcript_23549:661-1341(-)